jgi:hypothetical protein
MLDLWLLQLRLFPRQLWQTLQALAQRCLTVLVGLVMPLVLFLGFSSGLGRSELGRAALEPIQAATALGRDAWRNLSHSRVEADPTEVARRDQSDRRGAMQERRAGQSLDWQPQIDQPNLDQVWLPGGFGDTSPSEPWLYQTLLPGVDLLQQLVAESWQPLVG